LGKKQFNLKFNKKYLKFERSAGVEGGTGGWSGHSRGWCDWMAGLVGGLGGRW